MSVNICSYKQYIEYIVLSRHLHAFWKELHEFYHVLSLYLEHLPPIICFCLNMWYLGLLWSLFICLFGLRFPAFAWTPKTYSLQIVACNSLGSHAFAAAIAPLAIPLGESGMNYSLHTVQEECSHLVMECSGLFNAQGLKSWKP